jgi:hypothetical protein
MNRSWIEKLSRAICPAIVGTLVLATWATVQAAPLGTISLQGRKAGGDWSSNLMVAEGEVIEYRIMADVSPVGTTNGSNSITDASTNANSGFQSLFLQVTQEGNAPIQVNFRPPLSDPNGLASFRNGWSDGTGASAGTLTPRAGGTNNDITAIRPVHAAGVYTGFDAQEVLSGSTFAIATAPVGATTVLAPSWKPTAPNSGALRINGAGNIFLNPGSTTGADPVISLQGLTLTTIPEPSTIALVGMGLIGLVAAARRRRAA